MSFLSGHDVVFFIRTQLTSEPPSPIVIGIPIIHGRVMPITTASGYNMIYARYRWPLLETMVYDGIAIGIPTWTMQLQPFFYPSSQIPIDIGISAYSMQPQISSSSSENSFNVSGRRSHRRTFSDMIGDESSNIKLKYIN